MRNVYCGTIKERIMKDLIRTIRTQLHLNTEQLASLTGVSFETVDRWESGKGNPCFSVQQKLYKLCTDNQLELSEYIAKREMEQTEGNGNVLYHASRTGIEGSIRPISRSMCDFGKGFYMGTDPLQPLTLVCNEKKPVFYTVELDMHGLKVLNVEIGIDWAMMIAYYRGYIDTEAGSEIFEKYSHMADGYDVVVGYIANDRMYQVLTEFFEMRITDTALIGSLSALKLGKQYVAVTQKACDRIRIIKDRPLQQLELMILRDRSVVRRNEGIALAKRITAEHRRDGRFFDEIIQGVGV